MPRRVAQNVSLTPEHAAFNADLVASGRHAGVSAVVRVALDGLARSKARRRTLRVAHRPRKAGVNGA